MERPHQPTVHGDIQVGARLHLAHLQDAIPDLLAPHPRYVGSTLAGVEQQRQRQASPGSSEWVSFGTSGMT
jgi:hypothetical protein